MDFCLNELKKEANGTITAVGSGSMEQSHDTCAEEYNIKTEERNSATQL